MTSNPVEPGGSDEILHHRQEDRRALRQGLVRPQDASSYPTWGPAIERIEGRIGLGEKMRIFSRLNPGRAFPIRITELDPCQRMVWTAGMPFGLFRGVRTFELLTEGRDSTGFSMREEFTGPLLPLVWRSMPGLTDFFESFASGLKARSEAS